MEEDKTSAGRAIMPLKNGGQIEARLGLVFLESLRLLLEEEPQHFKTLLAIVQGKTVGHERQSLQYLREWAYLGKDGRIHPDCLNILLSSYQESKEGPVLVNPFVLTDQSEARKLETYKDANDEKWRRIINKIIDSDRDKSP